MDTVDAHLPPLSWAVLRDLMERAIRGGAWREVGLWTLKTLEAHLGPDWPSLLAAKLPLGGELELAYMSGRGHVVAYTNALELALRLEMLARAPGIAKVRRSIATDPRPELLVHARLQLEVAALAARRGTTPKLEPSRDGGRPADAAFSSHGHEFIVETRVVIASDDWREHNRLVDGLFAEIRDIELQYSVRCDGDFSRLLTDDETNELLSRVTEYARLVAAGAVAPLLRLRGRSFS